jgi:hypothetical protein
VSAPYTGGSSLRPTTRAGRQTYLVTAAAASPRACWRVLVLAALTVVLALMMPAVPASATPLPAAETRVGIFEPAIGVVVGVHECITTGQRPVRGPSQLQTVVGNCFAAEAGAGVVPNLHHTVPTEILKLLPKDVASNSLVRGRAGAPNRWSIPEDVHKGIHTGAGGGAYNQAWKDALEGLGRAPAVDDILRFRDQITKQFGIDIYRP